MFYLLYILTLLYLNRNNISYYYCCEYLTLVSDHHSSFLGMIGICFDTDYQRTYPFVTDFNIL